MNFQETAKQLESLILAGKRRQVQELLQDVKTAADIDMINNQFPDRDPVVLAVDKGQESIATFLIEKGFPFSTLYTTSESQCNQWCHSHHQTIKCPMEYNALDMAKTRELQKVVTLIQEIQNGLRNPGEGLVLNPPGRSQTDSPRRSPVKSSGKILKAVPSPELNPSQTEATHARRKLERYGITYITKDGFTLLHEAVANHDNPAMVHVCANARININAQNFDGDTALHIAMQKRHLKSARALLMNGSDLTLRNKLGLTALDLSDDTARSILESYRCGMVAALSKGEQNTMQRIMRLWPNPDAVVMHGVMALELAEMNRQKGKSYQACYNLLKGSQQTLRLVHAVLSEDLNSVKEVLKEEGGYNINVRYKDKLGPTPLSCAIDQHSLELVQLLMETGRCHTNVRVRDNWQTNSTVPVYFKTLDPKCPVDIWRYFVNNSDNLSLSDRDCHGNTGLLHAIANGQTADFIKVLLTFSSGQDLPYRNLEGLHARDMAKILGKEDIVGVIDQYICDNPSYLITRLAVSFYGEDNLQISNKEDKDLLNCVVMRGTEHDVSSLKQYSRIEEQGNLLFKAAASGDVVETAKLNTAGFQDKNGYTALTYAVVFNRSKLAENLVTQRPSLCALPDNNGRVPLHYAYALPEAIGSVFVKLLLSRDGDLSEHCADTLGREPAEYKALRGTKEATEMFDHVLVQMGHTQGKETPIENGA